MGNRVNIEADFVKSWDETEEFYSDLFSHGGWNYVKPIMPVIRHLRSLGYDKTLRAGTSLYTLVLSRSRNWGLREDQHFLAIEPKIQHDFIVWYADGSNPAEKLRAGNLIGDDTFRILLNQLSSQPID